MSVYSEEMQKSIKKVEAKRAENAALEPRRMTADEKTALLKAYHPDYKEDEFAEIKIGANKGQKAPKELVKLLEGKSRIEGLNIDLDNPDYDSYQAAHRRRQHNDGGGRYSGG